MFPINKKQVKTTIFAASVAGLFVGSAQAMTVLEGFGNYGRVATVHTGSHNPGDFTVGRTMSEYHNGFISLDLTTNAGLDPILGATLFIEIIGFESDPVTGDGTETLSLFEATTSPSDVFDGVGSPNAGATFDDLGDGPSFGSVVVTGLGFFQIDFNQAGLDALNAAAGDRLAIGAALTSLGDNHPDFDVWNSEFIQGEILLRTTTVPEPSSTMLLGLGGLGILLRRKRG